MIADLTAEQIRDACDEVYRGDDYRHAPAQVFLDQFDGDPPTTFLRVAFPRRFTDKAARMLVMLGELLQHRHGEHSNLVFVIYFKRLDPHSLARHSIAICDR